MSQPPSVTARMQRLVITWQQAADRRAIFLDCYRRMTRNMVTAVAAGEFHDNVWVDNILHRFADYYFDALTLYEQDPSIAPPVWQQTHNAACRPQTMVLQNLLLGVNAHINYDLVLTLVDVLVDDWPGLPAGQRRQRYVDHCHVNDVIGRTIDEVQDEVLEQEQPSLDLIDKLFGRADEWLISYLITRWRDQVWQHAVSLLEAPDEHAQQQLHAQVEQAALARGEAILMRNGRFPLTPLL